MCDFLGHARQEANEIILFPSASSLSNKGIRLEKLPIGIRYSSISNCPIQFVCGPKRSRQLLSAAYCEERSPMLKEEEKSVRQAVNFHRNIIIYIRIIHNRYIPHLSTLLGLLLQTLMGHLIRVTSSGNIFATGCKELWFVNAAELS